MLTLNLDPCPVVTTARLTLRKLRESDKEEMLVMRSDPKLMHFIPRPIISTLEEAVTLIGTMNEMLAKNEGVNWGITFTGEDKLIGMIGFFRMQLEHHRSEIGYMLHRDYHGKGIMEEAVNAAVRYGFDEFKFHSIEAVIAPGNIASRKLIERCGFILEAHFKEKEFHKGEFKDILVYSKLTDVK